MVKNNPEAFKRYIKNRHYVPYNQQFENFNPGISDSWDAAYDQCREDMKDKMCRAEIDGGECDCTYIWKAMEGKDDSE